MPTFCPRPSVPDGLHVAAASEVFLLAQEIAKQCRVEAKKRRALRTWRGSFFQLFDAAASERGWWLRPEMRFVIRWTLAKSRTDLTLQEYDSSVRRLGALDGGAAMVRRRRQVVADALTRTPAATPDEVCTAAANELDAAGWPVGSEDHGLSTLVEEAFQQRGPRAFVVDAHAHGTAPFEIARSLEVAIGSGAYDGCDLVTPEEAERDQIELGVVITDDYVGQVLADATAAGTVGCLQNRAGLTDATPKQSAEELAAQVACDPDFLAAFATELQRLGLSLPAPPNPSTALDCNQSPPGPPASRVSDRPPAPKVRKSESKISTFTPEQLLAIELQDTIGLGLEAHRLSLTFSCPTLDMARAALRRAQESVSGLGTGRGLIGAIDARENGAGWHLYVLAIVGSRDEARTVKLAALEGFEFLPRSQKVGPVGFGKLPTVQDFESCVGYLLKPWAVGVRDLERDAVACGVMAEPWARYLRAQASTCRRCANRDCAKLLPEGSTKRRAFCPGNKCRQYVHDHPDRDRRRAPTEADPTESTDVPVASVASEPEPTPSAPTESAHEWLASTPANEQQSTNHLHPLRGRYAFLRRETPTSNSAGNRAWLCGPAGLEACA